MLFFRHKRRWYWAAQLLLWSSFALVSVSNYLMLHPGFGEASEAIVELMVAWVAVLALAGLLLTHLLRVVLIRSGLLHAGLGRQLLVLVVSKVGLSLAFYPVLLGLDYGLPRPAEHMVPLAPLAAEVRRRLPPAEPEEGFLSGFRVGAAAGAIRPGAAPLVSLDVQLGRSTWSHYTFVWLLGYLLIVAAERRLGAELRQARAEADLSRAELELLHRQINPHFLFNTLNSIRALALTDAHRTRTALTQLADLLRYSLRPPGAAAVIPLSEELRAVQDYLALEQTRFGTERLRVEVDVPAPLLAWPVPPAVLLTLVENAVKHGFSARPIGGTLGVRARQHDAGLTLTVSQPGCLAAPPHPVAGSGGLGLANTRQRLRALYGEAASLTLHENPGGTVVARLGLPATATPASRVV